MNQALYAHMNNKRKMKKKKKKKRNGMGGTEASAPCRRVWSTQLHCQAVCRIKGLNLGV
jgi:hypothetical protein